MKVIVSAAGWLHHNVRRCHHVTCCWLMFAQSTLFHRCPYLSLVAVPCDDLFLHTPPTFSLRGNIVVSICDHYNRNYELAVHAAVMAGKQTFFIKKQKHFNGVDIRELKGALNFIEILWSFARCRNTLLICIIKHMYLIFCSVLK